MNPDLLEKVLDCRSLPTLPAVAMKVVELTSSNDVSMKALADAIQNDQALTAKILKTVNSSLYGLRTRCSSINQAIVMLGLSAVKTLALGFTLVTAIRDSDTGEFDLSDHWRRALFTGISARNIANQAGLPNAEECFLGGLLQDLGAIALYQTLGRPYLELMHKTGGDHRKLAKVELETLEIQHPDVGAMLATRWKLPEQLVMPIKYHERPTAAPVEYSGIVRAVGLGNIASDLLTSEDPTPHLRRFYKRAEQWFALSNTEAEDALKMISQATRDVARLLPVPTSQIAEADRVLEQARKQLASVEVAAVETSRHTLSIATGNQDIDELTGVASRRQFDCALVAAFEQARAGVAPLSVALFDVDGLELLNAQYGREAGDTILLALAGRLEQAFAEHASVIARYDGGRFAVLLPKVDRGAAVKAAEAARAEIAKNPVELIAAKHGAPPMISMTASAGVASVDQKMAERIDQAAHLCAILEQAVASAKKAGRNTLRVFAPALAA